MKHPAGDNSKQGGRCHIRRQAIGIIGSARCIAPDVASCPALLRAAEVIE
jgi:hypothetical protein